MPFVCRLQSRNCERTLIFLPTKQITREVDLAIMNRAEPRDNSRTAESSITTVSIGIVDYLQIPNRAKIMDFEVLTIFWIVI